MEKRFTFKNTLFCEDARLDSSGRPLIIGIIPEHIRAFSLPLKLKKAFVFTEAFTHGMKAGPFTCSMKNPHGEIETQSVTAVTVSDWHLPFPLIVEFAPIELTMEGKYVISINDMVLREINVSKINEKDHKAHDGTLSEDKVREILKEAMESISNNQKKI